MSSEQPAITTYGEPNVDAPAELGMFSFLVGKWHGTGTAKTPDGKSVQFGLTWIGRYVLDGMAIADEFHGETPDGKPYLGISLRQYDAAQRAWIVEYLNVTGSFVRRQVNARSGSVRREDDAILVVSQDGSMHIRERYRLSGRDRFTYTTELSQDAGRTWGPPPFELALERVE